MMMNNPGQQTCSGNCSDEQCCVTVVLDNAELDDLILIIHTIGPCGGGFRQWMFARGHPCNRTLGEWYGVECTDLITGQYVGTVQSLTVMPQGCQGTLDFTKFPPNLRYLSLASNQLGGTPDLSHLPVNLEYLYLRHNQLGGSLDLTVLPSGLAVLDIGSNMFYGSIDLTSPLIPRTLTHLVLFNNRLTGNLDIRHLWPALATLDMSFNRLSNVYYDNSLSPSTTVTVTGNPLNCPIAPGLPNTLIMPDCGNIPTSICGGGNITAPNGTLVDDREDWAFVGLSCSTPLVAPAGQRVTVSFTYFCPSFSFNYLILYDGLTIASPVLGSFFCGASPSPTTYVSTGNTLLLVFTSKDLIMQRAFSLTWKFASN
jgi:hypothetical protein